MTYDEKYMVFGAGAFGKSAYEKLGEDSIVCFIDNDEKKQGTLFYGKEVLSLSDASKMSDKYQVLIASLHIDSMKKDLEAYGIKKYRVFIDKVHGFFETEDLIVNNYHDGSELTEVDWNNSYKIQMARKGVFDEVERVHDDVPLFCHVEIETINRCNGVCSFCPVNKNADTREYHEMSDSVFEKIVSELREMHYSGRLSLFSNNEPLLDPQILQRSRYLREQVRDARIHMFSNGTLMTIDIFKELVEYLDELVIDNYHQDLKLIKPCEEIVKYCESNPELKKKVTIVMRKPNEILTTRGGNAPNRKDIVTYDKDRCILPYNQLIIRPDGKVSLCCNDALGEYTLGDANQESLLNIWYGQKYTAVRRALFQGRENFGKCKYCDTFFVG